VDGLGDRRLYEGTLPAVPASVGTFRRELTRALEPLDVDDERLADIVLAVSEALTNVATHAYIGMAPGRVAVVAVLSGESLRVTVTDQGRGMIPRSDSPGLGLGVALMGRLADGIEISHPNGGGTEVCVSFRL